jgi:phosphopantothenoylcysteine decarboxylase/phosphopantothenate--cysteine ligase
MPDLRERRILLAVTGSIAAFKAAALASELTKAGASLRVMMTAGGQRFVSPETFRDLTGNPVATSLWAGETAADADHIDLAAWAELVVVAPATANVIARAALGLADDLVTTVLLAAQAPILMAPAMESAMWEHEATQQHVLTLARRGIRFAGPVEGRLASGASGPGRMVEPAEIFDELGRLPTAGNPYPRDLDGVRIVVSTGPTREPIDPVRYLSNRSSGKMGYEVARAAHARGAVVTLVSGPVDQGVVGSLPPAINRLDVETAAQMKEAVVAAAGDADMVIMAAAVADFRPAESHAQKLKKAGRPESIALEPTTDILQELRELAANAVRIGFAAETDDLLDNAVQKLRQKGIAMIVANDVSDEAGGVFGADTNQATLLRPDHPPETLPRMSKQELAHRILERAREILKGRKGSADGRLSPHAADRSRLEAEAPA